MDTGNGAGEHSDKSYLFLSCHKNGFGFESVTKVLKEREGKGQV